MSQHDWILLILLQVGNWRWLKKLLGSAKTCLNQSWLWYHTLIEYTVLKLIGTNSWRISSQLILHMFAWYHYLVVWVCNGTQSDKRKIFSCGQCQFFAEHWLMISCCIAIKWYFILHWVAKRNYAWEFRSYLWDGDKFKVSVLPEYLLLATPIFLATFSLSWLIEFESRIVFEIMAPGMKRPSSTWTNEALFYTSLILILSPLYLY